MPTASARGVLKCPPMSTQLSEQPSRVTDAAQPDLRTLEGQLYFLDYHAPDAETVKRHEVVNTAAQDFWESVATIIPDGPGKTRALHALNRARMECNSAIANNGA